MFYLLMVMFFGTITSLALPDDPTANISTPNLFLPEYQCVNDRSWVAPGFYPDACRAAFEYAKAIEAPHMGRKFEFVPNGARTGPRYQGMETPRRYNMSEKSAF